MVQCSSGIRTGCIIVSFARRWAEAAATTATRWGSPCALCCSLEELSKLLWGCGMGDLLVNVRRAEKPPSGKAAELVPGGFVAGWNAAEIGSARASGESDHPVLYPTCENRLVAVRHGPASEVDGQGT